MAGGWRTLSAELGRVSALMGTAAATAPTPGLGLLLGAASALGHLYRPSAAPASDAPHHALIARGLRAVIARRNRAVRRIPRRKGPDR